MWGAVTLTWVASPWNGWSRFTESFRTAPPSMTRSSLRAPAALMAARRSPDSPDCRQTGRDLRRVRVDREQHGTEHDTVVAVRLAVQVLDELSGCSLRVLAAPGGDGRACPQ